MNRDTQNTDYETHTERARGGSSRQAAPHSPMYRVEPRRRRHFIRVFCPPLLQSRKDTGRIVQGKLVWFVRYASCAAKSASRRVPHCREPAIPAMAGCCFLGPWPGIQNCDCAQEHVRKVCTAQHAQIGETQSLSLFCRLSMFVEERMRQRHAWLDNSKLEKRRPAQPAASQNVVLHAGSA